MSRPPAGVWGYWATYWLHVAAQPIDPLGNVQRSGCQIQSEEIEMTNNDHTVMREVTLHAGRDEVWRALTEPELAEQWLADEVELDLREDGEAVFRYESGEERRGRVREVVEEERLRICWRRGSRPESEVEFLLADAAAGTRVVVVESAPARSTLAAGSWGDRLFALEVVSLTRGVLALAVA